MINTTHGPMDESLLVKKEGTEEDDIQILNWVEYWLNDELVHRSVHIIVKQGLDSTGLIGE